jgi:hypothetical protein
LATAAELLAAVDAAILSVLTHGQALGTEGKTWTKADLGQLRETRKELQREVAAATHPLRRAWAGTVGRD